MPGQFKTDIEEATIVNLEDLIQRGEKLLGLSYHPGKSRELVEWETEVEAIIMEVWGQDSIYLTKYYNTNLFPNHYIPEVDAPLANKPSAVALNEAQVRDMKAAYNKYKQGMEFIVSLLKTLQKNVNNYGMPSKTTSQEVRPKEQQQAIPNITIKNINKNNQRQNQTVNVWVQELNSTIEEKLQNNNLKPNERTFLEKMKAALQTTKSLAELITLAYSTGISLGLSAVVVMRLLGMGV